ncbi:cytochrome c3 family protein [Mucispirillum schaedleri]|uniref:cytochrome c3 family protein n=1 Tax=Mucispirillum schaedleri TaxID=248039 RepID=UPI001F57F52D|nr:cytochrome c3 family protein [Mucispirillum schaedleri]
MKKLHLIMFTAVLLLITACAEQNPNEDLYGGNPNDPGYSAGHYVLDNSSIFNGGISAGVNASITNVSQDYYDKLVADNATEDKLLIQHDFEDFGNRNFNLLYRWGKSIVFDNSSTALYYPIIEDANSKTRPGRVNRVIIPKPELLVRQNTIAMPTMLGVSFPHEAHRHVFSGINFVGKDGKHFIPVSGCALCHSIDTEEGKVASTGFHAYETPAAIFMQHNLTRANKTISGYSTATNPAHEFCWNSCHTKIAEPTVAPKTTDCSSCHRIQQSYNIQYPTPTVK